MSLLATPIDYILDEEVQLVHDESKIYIFVELFYLVAENQQVDEPQYDPAFLIFFINILLNQFLSLFPHQHLKNHLSLLLLFLVHLLDHELRIKSKQHAEQLKVQTDQVLSLIFIDYVGVNDFEDLYQQGLVNEITELLKDVDEETGAYSHLQKLFTKIMLTHFGLFHILLDINVDTEDQQDQQLYLTAS